MSKLEEAYKEAEEYKKLVFARTKISPRELICPREQSDMTPCIAREGKLSCSDTGQCVGCDKPVFVLLAQEKKKHEEKDPEL